jgi:hypothetical protein
MRLLTVTTALLLTGPTAAQTPQPAQNCAATTPALPPELTGWPNRAPLTAATIALAASQATLAIGRSAQLRLSPTTAVRYPVRPGRPAAPSTNGGIASFTVARPGTYRVALGSGMWIDVVQGGQAIASTTHAHGPACSGIRKIVDFRLRPGRHLLQISGGKEPNVTILVVPVD